jgi:hypothetical protein
MVFYLYNTKDDSNTQAPSIHSFNLQTPVFRSPSFSSYRNIQYVFLSPSA